MTGTVCTLFELQNGDDSKNQGWYMSQFTVIFYAFQWFAIKYIHKEYVMENLKNSCAALVIVVYFFCRISWY